MSKHNLWETTNAVEVKNGDIGGAMRKLKKFVYRENILIDYMAHTFYEKPSVRKRRENNIARRRMQKETALRLADL